MKRLVLGILISISFVTVLIAAEIKTSFTTQKNNIDTFIENLDPDRIMYFIEPTPARKLPFKCDIQSGKLKCVNSNNYEISAPINKGEYEIIGSTKSYLHTTRTYWTMTEDGSSKAYEVNKEGSSSVLNTSNNGIRSSVYIYKNVKIKGLGTITNPFRFIGNAGEIEMTLSLKNKNYNSISVEVNATDPIVGINTYEYSKDRGNSWSSKTMANMYTFSGLVANTKYYIKVRVTNNYGLTEERELEVTTDAITLPGITLTSPSKTYNSVSLTATGRDTQTGIKSGTYQFSKDNGVTWTTAQAGNTYIFSSLSANTTYNFKARVQNNGGLTGTSSTLPVVTTACTAPVVSLTSPSKTYNSISLTASASDNQSGIKSGTYQFSKDNGSTWTALQSGNTYNFTGLTSGSAYNFKVRVQNNCGITGTSATLPVVTTACIAPVIILTSPSKTISSVSLTASASDNQSGIKAWTYQFSKDNGVTWTPVQSGATYNFTGLTSGTTYNFKVRVQNNCGITGTSSTLAVTTTNAPVLKDTIIATTGLYTAPDDYGTSYYFKGDKATIKNNVIFGGHQWKVVRITGSGDIKLLYNGTCPNNSCTINRDGTATRYTTSVFNGSSFYCGAGYMSGNSCGYSMAENITQGLAQINNSAIKNSLETFYSGLRQSAKNLVADTLYCNDIGIYQMSAAMGGFYNVYYGAYGRLVLLCKGCPGVSISPSLKCNKTSAYTVSDTTRGNGLSTYPIGLITMDEAMLIGTEAPSYLNNGQNYWTMSPNTTFGSSDGITVWPPYSSIFVVGSTSVILAYSSADVRPVITLKSTVRMLSGNGSEATPYIVLE